MFDLFVQAGSFGTVENRHIDFFIKSEVALKHLYFDDWTDVGEPYAIYARPDFFTHLDNVLDRVGILVSGNINNSRGNKGFTNREN